MATSPSSNLSTDSHSPSSAEIDGRRADQLAERAMSLAERGDLPAAILSCRQSIVLSPESSQSYSMLGLLLERAEDNAGAIAAYEKVLQLAPDSLLERESLGRLRVSAVQNRTTRGLFVFDDKELFGDERPEQSTPAPTKKKGNRSTPAAAPVAIQPVTTPETIPAIPNAAPSTQAAIAADAVAVAITAPAQKTAAPIAGNAIAAKSAMPFPSTMPTPSTASSAAHLSQPMQGVPDWPTKPRTLWQKLVQRPSFYFRAAPLALTSVMSLAFLLWAHNFAASRALTEPPPVTDLRTNASSRDLPVETPTISNANPAVNNPGAAVSTPTSAAGSGSAGAVPSNPGAATPSTPATGSRPTITSTTPRNGVPVNPGIAAPAAPRTLPATSTTSASSSGGSTPVAPAPRSGTPSTPDDIALPPIGSTSGGAAPGGTAGSGTERSRDYVRVTPIGTPRPAVRPESRAASDERAASASARSGDSGLAIARMSRAIESGGGDTAFRYQQRAQLYLQSGDNNRAINDFNSAIAAYNDMIGRGERVAFARTGIRASQRGIQLAQR